jgi:hypothetical protein
LYQVGMFCLGRDLLILNVWEPEGPIIITANGDFALKDIVELAYSHDGHEERMETLEFGMVGISSCSSPNVWTTPLLPSWLSACCRYQDAKPKRVFWRSIYDPLATPSPFPLEKVTARSALHSSKLERWIGQWCFQLEIKSVMVPGGWGGSILVAHPCKATHPHWFHRVILPVV